MPAACAGTRWDFAAALQISASGLWAVPNTACPSLPLNGNLFTSGSSPPIANFHQQQPEGFLICRRCRCIKKGQYFYTCRDSIFFYCYLMLMITTSLKESNFMKGKTTTGSRKEKHLLLFQEVCMNHFTFSVNSKIKIYLSGFASKKARHS